MPQNAPTHLQLGGNKCSSRWTLKAIIIVHCHLTSYNERISFKFFQNGSVLAKSPRVTGGAPVDHRCRYRCSTGRTPVPRRCNTGAPPVLPKLHRWNTGAQPNHHFFLKIKTPFRIFNTFNPTLHTTFMLLTTLSPLSTNFGPRANFVYSILRFAGHDKMYSRSALQGVIVYYVRLNT